jgi:hypothetical protein
MSKNKYNAEKITVDSITFDSQIEAARYFELKMLEKAGKIGNLARQRSFELIPRGKKVKRARNYIADFDYWENGKYVVEDVKGCKTPVYTLKRDLLLHTYPFINIFREYTKDGIRDFL